jgi:hypothetical protein
MRHESKKSDRSFGRLGMAIEESGFRDKFRLMVVELIADSASGVTSWSSRSKDIEKCRTGESATRIGDFGRCTCRLFGPDTETGDFMSRATVGDSDSENRGDSFANRALADIREC